MFVKIRKPQRISFESRESSSVGSVRGFFGKSQAVTIVMRDEISGLPAVGGGAAPRHARAGQGHSAGKRNDGKTCFHEAVDSSDPEA